MSNPSVDFYQQFVGEKITNAPSAFGNWLGGTILKVEEDSLSIEFEVKEHMTNPAKVLHGGLISAMMDEIIGMTILVNGEKNFFFSVNLNVNFVSIANVGSKVLVTTKIYKKSPKLIQAECVMTGPENKLVAKGTANLMSV